MPSTYMAVVIQLPDDSNQRSAIAKSFAIGKDFNGERIVTANSSVFKKEIKEVA